MDISLQAGGLKIPQTLPGARSADTPVVKKAGGALSALPKVDVQATEQQRTAQLAQAAKDFFKDVFAVSDTTFSIFKDSTGQYITRFTSLRDGRVTYIPEPQILQYIQKKQQARQALVELTV